jgi:hypothetical protein
MLEDITINNIRSFLFIQTSVCGGELENLMYKTNQLESILSGKQGESTWPFGQGVIEPFLFFSNTSF